jgi:hypothetical protein
MPIYQVVNKAHARATLREEHAVDTRGNPFIMVHSGPPVLLEVGALVDDLTPEEIAAFPDRFQLVEGQALRPAGAPTPVVNPELLAIVRRGYEGAASKDEAAMIGDILAFMEAQAQGGASAEMRASLEAKLGEFGLALFL